MFITELIATAGRERTPLGKWTAAKVRELVVQLTWERVRGEDVFFRCLMERLGRFVAWRDTQPDEYFPLETDPESMYAKGVLKNMYAFFEASSKRDPLSKDDQRVFLLEFETEWNSALNTFGSPRRATSEETRTTPL